MHRRSVLSMLAVAASLLPVVRAAPLLGPRARPLEILPVLVETLLPADKAPGAVDLGVDRQLLERTRRDPRYRRLLERGCRWLDDQAPALGALAFAELEVEDREAVIDRAARAPARTLPRRFFDRVWGDVRTLYYSHPASWPALGYGGPPQPLGFPGHHRPPGDIHL